MNWNQIDWHSLIAGISSLLIGFFFGASGYAQEFPVGLSGNAARGWVSVRSGASGGFSSNKWIQVDWDAYNDWAQFRTLKDIKNGYDQYDLYRASYRSRGGETRVSSGDLDGDGSDELAVGLSRFADGWLEIRKDKSAGYEHKAWVRMSWPEYNQKNGETIVTFGDVNGDDSEELIIGLGPGGEGWFEIKDYSDGSFSTLAWGRVNWSSYNQNSGLTRPAAGDLDGDDADEILIGLSKKGDGWVEVKELSSGSLKHVSWLPVNWPDYRSNYGTTNPAAGDLDDDGTDEAVIGLGRGGKGWFEVKADPMKNNDTARWGRVNWSEYNNSKNAVTRPVVRNTDSDSAEEVILGLSSASNGWFEVKNGSDLLGTSGWGRVDWSDFTSEVSGGGTQPTGGTQNDLAIVSKVEDLDGNGDKELIVTTINGTVLQIENNGTVDWSFNTGVGPVLVRELKDLDGDTGKEMLAQTKNGMIYTIDDDGTEIWSFDTGKGPSFAGLEELDGDSGTEAVATNGTGDVILIDDDGSQMLSFDSGNSQVIVAEGANLDEDNALEAIVTTESGDVIQVDDDGTEDWSVDTGNHSVVAPVVSDLDGDPGKEVIATTKGGMFYKIDDGTTVWSRNTGSEPVTLSEARDVDGDTAMEFMLKTDDGRVLEYKADGTKVWSFDTRNGPIFLSDRTDLEGDLVTEMIATNSRGIIFRITGDGTKAWEKNAGEWPVAVSAIRDLEGDTGAELIASNGAGEVKKIDGNGEQVWSFNTGKFGALVSGVADVDGDTAFEMIAANESGSVFQIDDDGTRDWKSDVGVPPMTVGGFVEMDGDSGKETIAGNGEGRIFLIDSDGTNIWEAVTED